MNYKQHIKKFIGPKKSRIIKHMLGYSSLNEVEIVYDLLKNSTKSKIMIDVGAHHGSSLDEFAYDNWQIFAFEPDPKNRSILLDLCKAKYPMVKIDSRAVSNQHKQNIPLYSSDISTGISSLSSFHESHKVISTVETVTLKEFFRENDIGAVDFLKIDAEGHDFFVLQGIPWEDFSPRVIICEFEDKKTLPLGYDFHEMAKFLMDNGYQVWVSEWYPIVTYGTKHRWRHFAKYPIELTDHAAWGNLIAIHKSDSELEKMLLQLLDSHAARYKFS